MRPPSKQSAIRAAAGSELSLKPHELVTLVKWLTARYKRASFADECNRRFKQKAFYSKFVSIIERTETHIQAVLFDVDQGATVERAEHDLYELRKHLIYKVSDDPTTSQLAAEKAAAEIASTVRDCFLKTGRWTSIELVESLAFSEDTYTLYDFRLGKEWYFDYLSTLED